MIPNFNCIIHELNAIIFSSSVTVKRIDTSEVV